MQKIKNCAIVFIFSLFLFSCASTDFSAIEADVSAGNYLDANSKIEADQKKLYSNHDKVLYYLDSGIISHYGTDWNMSNKSLSQAEQYMDEYFAKSISQAVGSYIVNDTVEDYAGEDYENVYTNLFMALNYIHLKEYEDAMVEIVRFDNKLKVISQKYDAAIEKARKNIVSESNEYETQLPTANIDFHNSAFGRYISMLLYRDTGDIDNAQVDKKYIDSAFTNQSQLYPFAKPESLEHELEPISKGAVRLNFISCTGLAPTKIAETTRLYDASSNTYFKFEIPIMLKQPDAIHSAKVTVYDEAGKSINTVNLEKLESIENIAVETFKQKQALVYLKAFLRSLSKTTASSAIVQNTSDSGMASLFSLMSNVYIELSEQADIRTSRFFPGTVWVGGCTIPEGAYRISVEYLSDNGNRIKIEWYDAVEAVYGQPNIVESICIN